MKTLASNSPLSFRSFSGRLVATATMALMLTNGCATTDLGASDTLANSSQIAATEQPHVRRRRASDEVSSPSSASANGRILRNQVLTCDAPPSAAAHCPQCPDEPTNASVNRGFHSVESAVLQCNPPALPNGKLAVSAQFENNGNATSFRFPGVSLTAAQQDCLRAALCSVRVPTFQRSMSTVRYEYVVMM